MSRSEDLLNAYWTIVEDDAALQALLGAKATIHKFAPAELLKKFDYEPAHCPVFLMMPASDGARIRPAFRERGEGMQDVLPIHVEGSTGGLDPRPALALRDAFCDAIVANRDALQAIGVQQVEFEITGPFPNPNKNELIDSWAFQVICVNTFRPFE